MIAAFNVHAIAQLSAARLVDCLIDGTLIAIFAGLMLRITRRPNSSTRFAVLFSALIAIAALPLAAAVWPSRAAMASSGVLYNAAITLPAFWALYLFGAWAAISLWFLAGVVRGVWRLHQLRKSCVALDPVLHADLFQIIERDCTLRSVALCESDHVHVPTAIGLMRPAVVLPRWVIKELSPDELHQILLHELAHLRRWDDWTNLAQKIVKALFFFHPAVWWIEKRVSLEREMACDEAVVAETARPRAYAECLAHLAEKTLIQRSIALAQAALGRIRHTSLRVAQVLQMSRSSANQPVWQPAVSLVAGFAVIAALGVSRVPRLIAFQDAGPVRAASTVVAKSTSDASERTATPAPIQAVFHNQPVRAVQATLRSNPHTHAVQRSQRAVAIRPSETETNISKIIRFTNANTVPVTFTETMFVVVESQPGTSPQPVYQIQMWRVVVFHPAVDSTTNRVSTKEI